MFPSDAVAPATFDYYTDSGAISTITAGFIAQNSFQISFPDLGVNGALDLYLGRFFQFNGIAAVERNGSILGVGTGYTFDATQNLLTIPYTGATEMTITFVPEPSGAALGLVGSLGVFLFGGCRGRMVFDRPSEDR